MDFLDEHVGTQYEDYNGLVSIDCHGGGLGQDIFGMCRDFGIDTKLKFPIAIKFSEFTTQGIGGNGTMSITIYTVDKEEYGESFDEIQNKIRNDNGTVRVDPNDIYVPYDQLGKYIKRFDIMAVNHMRDYITSFEINED